MSTNLTRKCRSKKRKHLALGRVLIKLVLDFLQPLSIRLSDESSKPEKSPNFFLYVGRIARIARISKNIKSKIYDESLSRRGVQFNVRKKA